MADLCDDEEIILQCNVNHDQQQSTGVLVLTNKQIYYKINGTILPKITIPYSKYSGCFYENKSSEEAVTLRIKKTTTTTEWGGDVFTFIHPIYRNSHHNNLHSEDDVSKVLKRKKVTKKILLKERKCFVDLLGILSKKHQKLKAIKKETKRKREEEEEIIVPAQKEASTDVYNPQKYQKLLEKEDVQKTRQRATVLAKYPDLKYLHGEFVPKILREEEFWEVRQNIIPKENLIPEKQFTGLSTTMYSEIEPTSSAGVNYRSYHLTPQIIKYFFVEFPGVKTLYDQRVPHSMSKEEFWRKFFLSPYYDENRMKKASTPITDSPDDIFKQQCKPIDLSIDPFLKIATIDPLLDITRNDQIPTSQYDSLSYTDLNSIRKINRHGYIVLNNSIMETNRHTNNQNSKTNFERSKVDKISNSAKYRKETFVKNSLPFSDLSIISEQQFLPLKLTDQKGYVSLASSTSELPLHSVVEENTVSDFANKISNFSFDNPNISFEVSEAIKPLNKIQSFSQSNFDSQFVKGTNTVEDYKLPPDYKKKIKEKYLKASEILRHFWGSFPIENPELVEKVNLLGNTISRLYDDFSAEQSAMFSSNENSNKRNLFGPILDSLNTAIVKYEERK